MNETSLIPDDLAERYGRMWASRYDELYDGREDTTGVVDTVRRHASTDSVVEFGIGTGRLALPLAAAGLRVHGVDSSPEMLAVLHAKPGADQITTSCADMTDVQLGERFGAVLIAFSTLMLLPDAKAQQRCIATAAQHLLPGGALIVETMVMDPNRWFNNKTVTVNTWEPEHVAVNIGVLNPTEQVIETVYLDVRDGQTELRRNRLRYVTPSELDLMAQLHDLSLAYRAADFAGSPFTATSGNAVSVYRSPGATAESVVA